MQPLLQIPTSGSPRPPLQLFPAAPRARHPYLEPAPPRLSPCPPWPLTGVPHCQRGHLRCGVCINPRKPIYMHM